MTRIIWSMRYSAWWHAPGHAMRTVYAPPVATRVLRCDICGMLARRITLPSLSGFGTLAAARLIGLPLLHLPLEHRP